MGSYAGFFAAVGVLVVLTGFYVYANYKQAQQSDTNE